MARIKYVPNRVIDHNGISDGANVFVYQSGTTTPVQLYLDEALTEPVSNPYPVPTGAPVPVLYHDFAGNVRMRVVAADGSVPLDEDPYDISVLAYDLASSTGAERVGVEDGATLQQAIAVAADPSSLIASTDVLPVGATVRTANGYLYKVLSTADADYDVVTASGAKLEAIPNAGAIKIAAFGLTPASTQAQVNAALAAAARRCMASGAILDLSFETLTVTQGVEVTAPLRVNAYRAQITNDMPSPLSTSPCGVFIMNGGSLAIAGEEADAFNGPLVWVLAGTHGPLLVRMRSHKDNNAGAGNGYRGLVNSAIGASLVTFTGPVVIDAEETRDNTPVCMGAVGGPLLQARFGKMVSPRGYGIRAGDSNGSFFESVVVDCQVSIGGRAHPNSANVFRQYMLGATKAVSYSAIRLEDAVASANVQLLYWWAGDAIFAGHVDLIDMASGATEKMIDQKGATNDPTKRRRLVLPSLTAKRVDTKGGAVVWPGAEDGQIGWIEGEGCNGPLLRGGVPTLNPLPPADFTVPPRLSCGRITARDHDFPCVAQADGKTGSVVLGPIHVSGTTNASGTQMNNDASFRVLDIAKFRPSETSERIELAGVSGKLPDNSFIVSTSIYDTTSSTPNPDALPELVVRDVDVECAGGALIRNRNSSTKRLLTSNTVIRGGRGVSYPMMSSDRKAVTLAKLSSADPYSDGVITVTGLANDGSDVAAGQWIDLYTGPVTVTVGGVNRVVDLGGRYQVQAADGVTDTVTLMCPAAVNRDWLKLAAVPGQTTPALTAAGVWLPHPTCPESIEAA